MTKENSGLLPDAGASYAATLGAEFKSTIAELKAQLKTAETLVEQSEIEENIAQTKRDYKEKSAGNDYVL